MVEHLSEYSMNVTVVDPLADLNEVRKFYNIDCLTQIPSHSSWDAVVLTVAHNYFLSFSIDQWSSIIGESGILLDMKGFIPEN